MTPQNRWGGWLGLAAVALLLAPGCTSSDTPAADAAAPSPDARADVQHADLPLDGPPVDTTLVDTTLVDTTLVDTTLVDTTLVDTTLVDTMADTEPGVDRGVVTDCATIGATGCFGNVDCAANERCDNVGSELDPVACCVQGARGTVGAGQSCASENDCASAVCVAGTGPALCSKDCAGAADCPAEMPRCVPIAMSGSSLKWCFPED